MINLDPHRDRLFGRRIALLDIDGVIADERHRQHHALAREWGEYFAKMVHDTVWPQGRSLYDGCTYADWEPVYLTGRREDTRPWTVNWLQRHGFDHTLPLLMRPQEVRVPLAELKAAVVRELLRFTAAVAIYDDDPEVIAHAAQLPGARAVHCTWHIKPRRMVKAATA